LKDKKIAIIEDERDILELIEYNLLKEGFSTICSSDGAEGFKLIKKTLPDLAILDIMLPGMNGLNICKNMKSDPSLKNVPIIIVTAKGDENDIILGLELGADDYVTKPFSPKALVSRVKAVLRRGPVKSADEEREKIVIHGISIDISKHEVQIDNKPVAFTATEFKILRFFTTQPGRVFTRDQLLKDAMGDSYIVDRNVDVHIKTIRKKMGKYREYLETVRSVGYRFRENPDS